MIYKQYSYNSNGGPGFLWSVIVLVAIFAVLYFVFKGILWLFTILAPILFILTIIFDFKVILNFINFIITRFKSNVLVGILLVILAIIFYPLVTGFLFVKAAGNWYVNYKLKKIEKEKYTQYEDVQEVDDDEFLQLPDSNPASENKKNKNDYDQLFK